MKNSALRILEMSSGVSNLPGVKIGVFGVSMGGLRVLRAACWGPNTSSPGVLPRVIVKNHGSTGV